MSGLGSNSASPSTWVARPSAASSHQPIHGHGIDTSRHKSRGGPACVQPTRGNISKYVMIMEPEAIRQLVRIQVDGLVGRFSHDIHFDPDWRFLILHGPNGIGKTRLLELLHSLFSGRYLRVANTPFSSARLEFTDQSWVEVSRTDISQHQLRQKDEPYDIHSSKTVALDWTLSLANHEVISYSMRPLPVGDDSRVKARLERRFPVEEIGFDSWVDHRSGDLLSFFEVVERYSSSLPASSRPKNMPSSLSTFLDDHEVHLIETQRLLHTHTPSERHRPLSRTVTQKPTVISYAEDLVQEFDAALATNSRTTQQFDRSFPKRLFQEFLKAEDESHLVKRYNEQQHLRSRLAQIAILDPSPDLQLPEGGLLDWQQLVLRTYLDDADAKLNTFQSLLDRLELLRDIINGKFLFKRLEYDRDKGIVFKDSDSGDTVSLSQLSSGEQHELVLLYDLLMKVSAKSLVLIDEPEISLHVAWQQSFLDDLDRVASLRGVRFIISTHSPQVIGRWWDRGHRTLQHTLEFVRENLDADDLHAYLGMLRTGDRRLFFVVEGDSDVRALGRRVIQSSCLLICGYGKSAVLKAMAQMEQTDPDGCVALVDRDFDDWLGKSIPTNVFTTDLYDRESDLLLKSGVLKDYVGALTHDGNRCDLLKRAKESSVVAIVVAIGAAIGRVRWVSERDKLDLNLSKFPVHSIFSGTTVPRLDEVVALALKRSNHPTVQMKDILGACSTPATATDDRLCNGHDLVSALAVSSEWWARRRLGQKEIVDSLLVAVRCDVLEPLQWFNDLKAWAGQRGYVLWDCVEPGQHVSDWSDNNGES